MNQLYLDTARLLTQVAPLVFADGKFALKGGTAINLFIRDMPRLSVDLDLVFPDHSLPRDEALARINEAILQSAERLKARGFKTHALAAADAGETKLLVRRAGIEVKVEVNFVMRGTVYPVRTMSMTPMARTLLADVEIPVVSLHNRPVHEVLFPAMCDVELEYERNFKGMTTEPVELGSLLAARERMVQELQRGLEADERRFLLSLVAGRPDWPALGIAHAEQLPGIRWKLHNLALLERKSPVRFAAQAETLALRLG